MPATTPRLPRAQSRRRSLTWASATVTALVASSLTLTAAPASAATAPAPVLKWEISQQFDDHLSTHVLTGGALEDADGVVTFPGGTTTVSSDAVVTTTYAGSVTGAFVNAGTEYYRVTIANPTVTVNADGSGSLKAEVSSRNAAAMGNPEASTDPAQVVVTTFGTTGTVADAGGYRTRTTTPDWDGVLPAGSADATRLELAEGTPVDGKSFAPSFLGQLTKGVRAHFYATSATAEKKRPAQIVAQLGAPDVTAAITSQSATGGVQVKVSGIGFSPGSNPGDDGVYVGVAPSGGLPDVSDREHGMASFVAVAWVSGSQITAGKFTSALTVPAARLDRSKRYSVYTWRAHSYSDASQDTETPLAIDYSALRSTAAVSISGPASFALATSPAYVVKVASGTGTVRLSGAGTARTATLSGGTARFVLPKNLWAGARVLTFSYSGDAVRKPGTVTRRVVIAKGATVLSHAVARRATKKKAGILTVAVRPARAGSLAASGKVQVVLSKGKKRRVVTSGWFASGRVNIALPKVAKGTWKAQLRYLGSGNYLPSSGSRTLKVTRR